MFIEGSPSRTLDHISKKDSESSFPLEDSHLQSHERINVFENSLKKM